MSERLKPLGKMLERLDTVSTFQIVGKYPERGIMGLHLAAHQAVKRRSVDASGSGHGLKVAVRECGPDLVQSHVFLLHVLHMPKF